MGDVELDACWQVGIDTCSHHGVLLSVVARRPLYVGIDTITRIRAGAMRSGLLEASEQLATFSETCGSVSAPARECLQYRSDVLGVFRVFRDVPGLSPGVAEVFRVLRMVLGCAVRLVFGGGRLRIIARCTISQTAHVTEAQEIM